MCFDSNVNKRIDKGTDWELIRDAYMEATNIDRITDELRKDEVVKKKRTIG
jgi:hypothetical protein|tara:strand:+ start:833 stop:985 length:153 start_codon:yes stop_codon:yes gene_type:complete